MKQSYVKSLVFLIVITIDSCYSPVNHDYHRAIERVDVNKFLIDHFPENLAISSDKFSLSDKAKPEIFDDFAQVGYCFLKIPSSKEELILLIDSLNKSDYTKYSADEGPVFVPLRFSDRFRFDKNFESKYIDYYVSKDSIENKLLPIPNFKDQFEFGKRYKTITGLPSSYLIYVLESNKIDNIEKNEIKFPLIDDISRPLFPSQWGHGYSKGISVDIDGNEIIYWSIFW